MSKRKKKTRKKSAIRTILLVLAAVLLLFAALTVGLRCTAYGDGFGNSVYAPDAFAGNRALVLVPHEDDDILIAGATARLYLEGGADVYVAFATNGDNGSDPDTRIREAVRGLSVLGVPKDHIFFLGYGDCWDLSTYKHIYHAPDDALVASESAKTETYGAGGYSDFHTSVYQQPAAYTRANFIDDIRSLLVILQPDTIFCIDLDSHTDHIGLSLLFEEALGDLLRDREDYRPQVFKGYAYSVAWFGADDFYNSNVLSAHLPDRSVVNDPRFPLDDPTYRWEDRVRFPVPRDALSYTLRSNIVFSALAAHASQQARFRAVYAVNGDSVYFERRTDSLTYLPGVSLSASSGDTAGLNDFKLVDTDNVLDWPISFRKGLWQPDAADAVKSVTVTLPARRDIASVSLYDFYEPGDNITSGTLSFSDGSTVPVGALNTAGQETRVVFDTKRNISSFTFTVDTFEGDAPGLSELCAYAPEQTQSPRFIKLMRADGDESFLYRFTVQAGKRYDLSVYAYPHAEGSYTLSVTSGNSDITLNGSVLSVNPDAKPGRHTITATSAIDPSVFDTVEVVVPGLWEKAGLWLLQRYERLLDRAEFYLLQKLG